MLPSSPIHSVQYTVTHFVSNPSSSTLNLKIFLFNKKIYIIVFLIKTKQNEKNPPVDSEARTIPSPMSPQDVE